MPSLPVSNLSEKDEKALPLTRDPETGAVWSQQEVELSDASRTARSSSSSLTGCPALSRRSGIFGGSLAHELVDRGWQVTLVDRYPPGHVRAASGGESRLIRAAHGSTPWYVRSARRAWQRWRQLEEESGASLLVPSARCGSRATRAGWEAESERGPRGRRHSGGTACTPGRRVTVPGFAGDDLAILPARAEAGVLRARDATRAMVSLARSKGVRFVGGERVRAAGGAIDVEGETLAADVCVWACGAWLAGIFPDELACV